MCITFVVICKFSLIRPGVKEERAKKRSHSLLAHCLHSNIHTPLTLHIKAGLELTGSVIQTNDRHAKM